MKTLPTTEQYITDKAKKFIDNIETEKRNDATKEFFESFDFVKKIMQQPQLNQFVRAVLKDGKWVVLEDVGLMPSAELTIYRNAKQNVLFSDWTKGKDNSIINSNCDTIYFDEDGIRYYNGKDEYLINSYSDLTKYNLPLTDNGEIYFNLKN